MNQKKGKTLRISKQQGDLFGYTRKELLTAIVGEILDRIGTVKEAKQIKGKETIPESGAQKFHIYCEKLGIYTNIGADNRHHASNKATKLFGPHWSFLTDKFQNRPGYQWYSVAEFSRLIRTLAI